MRVVDEFSRQEPQVSRHGYTYSAGKLLRHGLTRGAWPRMWGRPERRDSYEVVIIGGGLHGLATAYYLAENHGITNVAVVDKGYLGGGGSGRNTAIVRSNYLTPEGWPSMTGHSTSTTPWPLT